MSAEHHISYAYPTSSNAKAVDREHTGAFCVRIDGALTGYSTYAEALASIEALSSTPGRWSMDHPLNERFLTPEQAALTKTNTGAAA